jgi:hypothetical protein
MSTSHTEARFYVTLAVYSDSVTPDQMTAILGANPDRTVFKSAKLPARKLAPEHGWFITSEGQSVEGDCDDHIESVLRRLPDRASLLNFVRSGVEVRLWIFWESVCGNGGPWLSEKTIEALAGIGASLAIDVYEKAIVHDDVT